MGWRLGKGTHANDLSMSEPTQCTARSTKKALVFVQHTDFLGRGVLSQQTTSSEDMLPACSFSTTPVISVKIYSFPRLLYCIYGKGSLLTNAIHRHQKEYVKSYLAASTKGRAFYKTPLCDKKRKLPLPSFLYLAHSIHFPMSFPGIDSTKGVWVYSLLPLLTHTEVCGGQDFGIPLF